LIQLFSVIETSSGSSIDHNPINNEENNGNDDFSLHHDPIVQTNPVAEHSPQNDESASSDLQMVHTPTSAFHTNKKSGKTTVSY